MHVSICATIRFSISLWALSRFPIITSISSMKTRHGAIRFASSKISLIFFSDSPDIPATNEGADSGIYDTPISAAKALAIIVFPQPGGPCKRTPRGGCIPVRMYVSGYNIGIATSSFNSSMTLSTPPRFSNEISVGGVRSTSFFRSAFRRFNLGSPFACLSTFAGDSAPPF